MPIHVHLLQQEFHLDGYKLVSSLISHLYTSSSLNTSTYTFRGGILDSLRI